VFFFSVIIRNFPPLLLHAHKSTNNCQSFNLLFIESKSFKLVQLWEISVIILFIFLVNWLFRDMSTIKANHKLYECTQCFELEEILKEKKAREVGDGCLWTQAFYLVYNLNNCTTNGVNYFVKRVSNSGTIYLRFHDKIQIKVYFMDL
jgi:hypothetical protein